MLLAALILRLPAQTAPTPQQQAAIDRAVTLASTLAGAHPCPSVWQGLRQAAGCPMAMDRLPKDVSARTYADSQTPSGDNVFTVDPGNMIAIKRGLFDPNTGNWRMGMSTPQLNDLVLAGLLFAETGHQDLRTRLDGDGNPIPDPPGTPNPQTGDQNKQEFDKSEVEVADRLIHYIDWLVSAAAGPFPLIELTQKDRDQLDGIKKAAEGQKARHQ